MTRLRIRLHRVSDPPAICAEIRTYSIRRADQPFNWAVIDACGAVVDFFRSEPAANYAVVALVAGRASIDIHAPVGCRIEIR